MEFQVGGTDGWVVPPSNDTRIYNEWAFENRFQFVDAIRFRYTMDSVMEVEEGDYKNCNLSHLIFFSNAGNTIYRLNRSGAFYFISGDSGHCEIEQRMIVKVLTSKETSSALKLAFLLYRPKPRPRRCPWETHFRNYNLEKEVRKPWPPPSKVALEVRFFDTRGGLGFASASSPR